MTTQPTHTPGFRCKQGVMGAWCHSCAAMISAAPEMLEFLLDLNKSPTERKFNPNKMIPYLIAKAEGRG